MNRSPLFITLWVAALVAIGPLTLSMYGPSMPDLARVFDTSSGMVKLSLTVYLAGFALAQLVHGPLSDRFGRRPVLIWGLIIYCLASIACALATSIEALIVARLVQAFGAGAGPAVGRAIVRDLFDRNDSARVMAVVGMVLAVAPAVGPVAGGYLQVFLGWEWIFWVLGAFGLVLMISFARQVPETHPSHHRVVQGMGTLAASYRALLADRVFLGYLAMATVPLAGLFTFTAAAPFLIIDTLGVPADVFGWLPTLTVATYLVGGGLSARLIPVLGIEKLAGLGGLLMIAAGLAMVGWSLAGPYTVATIMAPMMAWTFAMGFALPNAMAGAMAPFPDKAGAASALIGFAQMGVGAAGSVIVSGIPAAASNPVWLAAILAGLALPASWLYYKWIWFPHSRPMHKAQE